MRRLFEYAGPARNLAPRYNIAPSQDAPVVRAADDGGARELAMLRWGLIPPWAKEAAIGNRMINARAETAAEKPSFRAAFKKRRCLVPADGFYEWKLEGTRKQPYRVFLDGGGTLAFAGLWERWRGGGETIESFAILTTDANPLLAPIHDRMPVILEPAAWPAWLEVEGTPPEALAALLAPAPDDALDAYPVSTRVNSPRNDDADCIARLR